MPIKFKKMPSYDRLNKLLTYNPDTGKLTWRVNRSNMKSGDAAGCIHADKKGRQEYKIRINNKRYISSRIIWMMYFHEDPGSLTIDHIDRNPLNNKITNLRLATAYQQNLNTCRTSATVLARRPGLLMQSRRSGRGRPRWCGQIRIAGHHYYFGSAAVNTIDDAPPSWLVDRASRIYAMRDNPGITDSTLIDEINSLKRPLG